VTNYLVANPITCLLYAYADQIDDDLYQRWLHVLPFRLKKSIEVHVFERDRKVRLLGKILLREGLKKLMMAPSCLYKIKESNFNRPTITDYIDFNISHSASLVACVISNESRVGLDVEQFRKFDLDPYRSCCMHNEWTRLSSSSDPCRSFIQMWTIKESISKAEGLGLHMPMNSLNSELSSICTKRGNNWHVKNVFLDEGYACALSHGAPQIHLDIVGFKLS
jgi:4'-phosphopantetheinyl transferase